MDNKDSISVLKEQWGEIFRSKDQVAITGEILFGDGILRLKDGKIDGGKLPGYEGTLYHLEYYKGGVLHRESKPAVIGYSDSGILVEEFWQNGKFIDVRKGFV